MKKSQLNAKQDKKDSLRKRKVILDYDEGDYSEEENELSDSSSTSTKQKPFISAVSLVTIIFYNVSGIPFLFDGAVKYGGNLYSVIGFIFCPALVLLPEAFMTAELGSALNCASGGIAWIEEAFGDHSGSIMGYISLINGATACAIFPYMFTTTTIEKTDLFITNAEMRIIDQGVGVLSQIIFLVGVTAVLTAVNVTGLNTVGNIAACVLASTFCFFFTYMYDDVSDIDHASTFVEVADDLEWGKFIHILAFLSYNSFDAGSHFVPDLKDISTFFSSMVIALLLLIAFNLYSLFVAMNPAQLSESHFLSQWFSVLVGFNFLVKYQAHLSSKSYLCMGLAKRGFINKKFEDLSSSGTPTYAIILCFIFVCFGFILLSFFNPDNQILIEAFNFNFSVILLLEIAAFVKLRTSKPKGPFKVPFNTITCCFLLLPAVSLSILLLLYTRLGIVIFFFIELILVSLFYTIMTIIRGRDRKNMEQLYSSDTQSSSPTQFITGLSNSTLQSSKIDELLDSDDILLY